jgi:hypothetical protein
MEVSMIEHTFDVITRRAAGEVFRRATILTLGTAGLTALAHPFTVEAKKNNRKNNRKKNRTCPDCPVCQNCPTCPPQCVGKALGDACQNIKECCGNETNLSCGLTDGGGSDTVCCGTLGAPCVGDADCCLPFFCPDGQCAAP